MLQVADESRETVVSRRFPSESVAVARLEQQGQISIAQWLGVPD